MRDLWRMVVHGGAGALAGHDYEAELQHMRTLIEAGRERLAAGGRALDVAVEVVAAMEASGLYVAGRGASPNRAGRYELDASVMEGPASRAGAVSALEGFASPIRVAQAVMERSGHVLLTGDGAAAFAAEESMERIADPKAWFTHAGLSAARDRGRRLDTGTVGCVVRDGDGVLAAATSTAGVFGKRLGRVGDSPIPGAGVWADGVCAVSCTGTGEMFLRTAAAAQLAFRLRFGDEDLEDASRAVLAEIGALGGEGGLIAIDAAGAIAMPFNSQGMKRAWLTPDGEARAEVF